MSTTNPFFLITGICVSVYAGLVGGLILLGRREAARALGGFIPDCVILFRRLFGDARISRGRKALLAAAIVYLAMPIDLVPDFIPVAGQLDDAIIVGLSLRAVLGGANCALLEEHWPGPPESLAVLARLTHGKVLERRAGLHQT